MLYLTVSSKFEIWMTTRYISSATSNNRETTITIYDIHISKTLGIKDLAGSRF